MKARQLVLGLLLLVLTACSVANAQSVIEPTQTALAQEIHRLRETQDALTIQATLTAPTATPDTTPHTKVYVFVRGADGLLYYKVQQHGVWTDWHSMQPPPGGAATDNPVAVQNDLQIELFVRGTDDALWHTFLNGGSWSDWESLGGKLTSGPGVVVVQP